MSFAYTPITLSGTSSGGGGAGRITVGAASAGANFTSIAAAMAASHNSFSIISDINAATITVPSSGLQISIDKGARLNIGSNRFDVGAGELQIDGNGILSYDSAALPVFDGSADAVLLVKDISLINSGSLERCLTDIDHARFSSVLSSGNYRICGNATMHHGGIYRNGTIQIPSTVSNTMIAGSIFKSMGTIADSGVNTVVDGAVVY